MMMMRNKFKMVLTSNFIDVKIILFVKKSYLKKDFKNDLKIYYSILLIYGGW